MHTATGLPFHYVLFERLALYTNMSMWHYCGTLLKSTLLNKDWNACSDILAKWSPGYMPWLLLKNHVPQRPSHVCPIGFKNVMRKNLPHPQSYTVYSSSFAECTLQQFLSCALQLQHTVYSSSSMRFVAVAACSLKQQKHPALCSSNSMHIALRIFRYMTSPNLCAITTSDLLYLFVFPNSTSTSPNFM